MILTATSIIENANERYVPLSCKSERDIVKTGIIKLLEEVVEYSNEEFELHFNHELSFWEKVKWVFIKMKLKRVFNMFLHGAKLRITTPANVMS